MTGIVILNYFSCGEVKRLFDTLVEFPDVRVLVVDNSSSTSERQSLLASIPESNLLFNRKNLGYAGGNNVGIRFFLQLAEITHIALLNPDIDLRSNIFPVLLQRFKMVSKLGAVGPRLCLRNDERVIYSDGGIFHRDRFLKPAHMNGGKRLSDPDLEQETEPDYINGSFLLLSREAIEDAGLLDDSFFLYFEEADWCMRARSSGWRLETVRDVTAWQTISPKDGSYNYYFIRSWIKFLKRYDSGGVGELVREQVKRTCWIASDRERSFIIRMKAAGYRLLGILSGIVRS